MKRSLEVRGISDESAEFARNGKKEIHKLGDAVGELVLSSHKIKEISSVIESIAFQTNLLALNAAVEAARAGEQGKGFALVAEAVRGLAQKCSESSKAIATTVTESFDKSAKGKAQLTQAMLTMEHILQSAEKIAAFNNEIASSSAEQTAMTKEILNSLNTLDELTQSNALTCAESADSSKSLEVQSQDISRVLSELRALSGAKVQKLSA